MRVLIVSDYLPYPPVSGDRLRVYHLLRRIAAQHEVTLAAPIRPEDGPEAVLQLRQFCQTVHTGYLARRHPLRHVPGLVRYALAGTPPELLFQDSQELKESVRQAFSTTQFDIVQVEHSCMAPYIECLPDSYHCGRVLVFHNIASQQFARIWRLQPGPVDKGRTWLHSQLMRRWEPHYAGRFDRCITVSEPDRRLLLAANPRLRVDVVPNGVDTVSFQPLADSVQPPALLFVGTLSYAPCRDAALLLLERILPLVRSRIPDIRVYVVGSDPPPEVARLQGDGVEVTGRVPDVVPYYRSSSVAVVPLRAGGGTRLKILEAMALGRPVVSTSIGCEGLDVVDGEHLLVADDTQRFADCIVRLMSDIPLRQQITANARQLVIAKYDWDAIAARQLDVYARLVAQP